MTAPRCLREGTFSLPALAAWFARIGGVLALIAAVFAPWFTVPGVDREPWSVAFYRVACVVAIAAAALRPRQRERVLLALFAALLLFPYFVTVWSPAIASRASWLQAQHESITASSGDLFLAQETKNAAWRQRVDVVNRPIDAAIIEAPDWTGADWGRVMSVFEWFGASPWFASFARIGWVLATAGTALCLLVLARPRGAARPLFIRSVLMVAAAVALAIIPPALSVACLALARTATGHGDAAAALRHLDRAAACLPALREDGYFLLQRGLLADALEFPTPEADLFRARLLELRGFDQQAQGRYLDGAERADLPPAIRREYLKALLSRAADLFNSSQIETAAALYEAVLARDPTNLRANYALQLVRVRTSDPGATRALQERMVTTYRGFNSPTRQAVLAMAHENVAFAEQLAGDLPAAQRALARARQP